MLLSKDLVSDDPCLEALSGGASKPPPLANRGVDPTPSQQGQIGQLCSRGLDWLSITTGPEATDWLLSRSGLVEEGKGTQGFAASERRVVGLSRGRPVTAWHKFQPYSPSRIWASDYHAWEVSGPGAHFMADQIPVSLVKHLRASRLDVAWDFKVDASTDADTFADLIRDHAEHRGVQLHDFGPEKNHTKYIGSRESARRVRVYRKDRQQPQFFPEPTLRVELELKADLAASVFTLFLEDELKAYGAAASHIHSLTGYTVDVLGDIPAQEVKPDIKASETLFYCLKQYGLVIDAAITAGIDVGGLARLRSESAFRHKKLRGRRMLHQFIDLGARETEEYLAGRVS